MPKPKKSEENKRYNPQEAEPRLQQWWEEQGTYKFDPKSDKKVFSIDTPPPTVSGKMHIGHSFSYSQMDFVARYKRMRGYNLFYPFGTDDNGLATEILVEKTNKVISEKMGRQEFVDLCLKTLDEIRPQYIADWKRIGTSCDYDIFYTTIDQHSQRIAQKAFLELYKQDRIARKESPIMICPKCQTAIAQVEMEDQEKEGFLYHIQVETEEGDKLVFATTRPDLYPACAGISVHPDDKRYKKLVGKKITMPITGTVLKLSTDESIDPEYGTGVVYYCTYGGPEDMEWLVRHPDTELRHIMDVSGRFNEKAGLLNGMKPAKAQEVIEDALKKAGAFIKKEPIKHMANVHERCRTPIEYVATEQWFVKYLDLKEKFLSAGRAMNWHPKHMINRLENWIKGLKWDWCISRQRFYGVPIPVWYCKECNEPMLPDDAQLPVDPLKDKPTRACNCGSKEFEPENDVLDTWFTSSHTPQIVASLFPGQYDKLFPMSLRPQAHDIITFWLFNTLVKSQMLDRKNPWDDIMISGWALDPKGRKMSKSKGNVIAPQDMLRKYSADALRFWAAGSNLGEDLPFQEKDLATGQKFATKMWNASRFVLSHLEDFNGKKPEKFRAVDQYILNELNTLIKFSTDSFDAYQYSKCKLETEKFFWHVFCDDYLEIVKDRLYNPDKYEKGERASAQYVLYQALLTSLKLMAPFMPYITEELWQLYFAKQEKEKSIHNAPWPEVEKSWTDAKAAESGALLRTLVTAVRQWKQSKQISLGAELSTVYIKVGKDNQAAVNAIAADLKGAVRAKEVKLDSTGGGSVQLELEGITLGVEQ